MEADEFDLRYAPHTVSGLLDVLRGLAAEANGQGTDWLLGPQFVPTSASVDAGTKAPAMQALLAACVHRRCIDIDYVSKRRLSRIRFSPHASGMLLIPLYIPCRPNRCPFYNRDIRRLFLPIPSSTTSNAVALSRTRSYAWYVSLPPSILPGVTPFSPFSKRPASATDASSRGPPGSRPSGICQHDRDRTASAQ